MNKNAQFVVKITSKDEIGSGFLHIPTQSSFAYIFTARHCIFGETFDNGAQQTDISVYFSDIACENETPYTLSENDKLLFAEKDIALLVIPISCIPLWIDKENTPKLFQINGKETECFINGFPKSVSNEHKRTLEKCVFVKDKDFGAQFQIEGADKVLENYNTDALLEGYSGSGIFVEVENQCFVSGVISEYEDNNKRFLCINFDCFEVLLAAQKLPKLDLHQIETNAEILKDIKTIQSNSDRIFDRIKEKIGDIHLERLDCTAKLKQKIVAQPFTIITGHAGIGKSAVVKKALFELKNDFDIIALQGEQLDEPSIAAIFKTTSFDLKNDIETLLQSPKYKTNKTIFIDSIEKVLESENVSTIIDFLSLLTKNTNLKLVVTCRTYAISQFQNRFLQEIKQNEPYQIPLLDDSELDEISRKYVHIQTLLNKPTVRKILQIPFNLNEAVKLQGTVLAKDITTEIEFKQLMWEYIIEKNNTKRAETLSNIAIKRAQTMTSFVKVEGIDDAIVANLVKENIIEYRPNNKKEYTPAHDIFEDWALTRYIEEQFMYWNENEDTNNLSTFFEKIGTSPTICRIFRIWLNEKLQISDDEITRFINQSLLSTSLLNYWKDEIIIATLQSQYCEIFLSKQKTLLFDNDFKLLKRAILLIRVACQAPDFDLINKLSLDKSMALRPVGNAWENMIDFIHANKATLASQYNSMIIPFLLDWEKCIDVKKPLPSEARKAGELLLDYFNSIDTDHDYFLSEQKINIGNVINLFFRLTEVVQKEAEELLEKALMKGYKRRDLSGKLIKLVLSWGHSRQVCKYLPKLVIKIAEKKWFYYKPTAAEWKERHKGMLVSHFPQTLERDEEFGVKNNFELNYNPSSAYQTPMYHVLWHDTYATLAFIVRLFNHSLKALLDTDFLKEDGYTHAADERKKIELILENGTTITQYGSQTLWCMYRGTGVVTPNVLQSVLMALENHLFSLPQIIQKDNQEEYVQMQQNIHRIFDFLLENSQSVATTAVLVSFATTYPDIVGRRILPLLRIKEFYHWDLDRRSNEISTFSNVDFLYINEPRYLQEERKQSDALPHRQRSLEDYMFFAGENSSFQQEIFQILDDFNSQNPKEQLWSLALNRMDCRKIEVVGKVESGVIVQAKLNDTNKAFIEEYTKDINITEPILVITNWSRERYKRDATAQDSFEEWADKYDKIANFKGHYYLNAPVTFAAIGIKDYFENLNAQQKDWCINQVFDFVKNQISKKRGRVDYFEISSNHNPFEDEPAFTIIAELVIKGINEVQNEAKKLVFESLLFLQDGNHHYPFLNKVREFIGTNAPDFIPACIGGLQEYSVLLTKNHQLGYFHSQDAKEIKTHNIKLVAYEKEIDKIVSNVVEGSSKIDLTPIILAQHSAFYLGHCIAIIPFDTKKSDLQKWASNALQMIFDNIIEEDNYPSRKNIHYQTLSDFKAFFAYYLLHQEEEIVSSFLNEMIDWIMLLKIEQFEESWKKVEFISEIFKNVVSFVDEQDILIPNFWIIWERLFDKMKSTQSYIFQTNLLLESNYWNTEATEWKPIKERCSFFEEVVKINVSIDATIQLLSGIGFTEVMPDGINWYVDALKKNEINLKKDNRTQYTEKLVQRVFYTPNVRTQVKNIKNLRDNYIYLLDRLIDESSASAFSIREDFITMK